MAALEEMKQSSRKLLVERHQEEWKMLAEGGGARAGRRNGPASDGRGSVGAVRRRQPHSPRDHHQHGLGLAGGLAAPTAPSE